MVAQVVDSGVSPALEVTLFGGFEARVNGEPVILSSKKGWALLAYVALQPGRAHSRDKLCGLLWEDSSDLQAKRSLRQVLFVLRRTLPDGVLACTGQTLAVDHTQVQVDALTFHACLRDGSARAFERAVGLYRGDLLDGLYTGAPSFEVWLEGERRWFRERTVQSLRGLLADFKGRGQVDRAIRIAVRLLSLDPFDESSHRALMELYVAAGRRGSALRQYALCRELLDTELGTTPEAETEVLYQSLMDARDERPGTWGPARAAAEPDGIRESGPSVEPSSPPELRPATIVMIDGAVSGEADQTDVASFTQAAAAMLRAYGATLLESDHRRITAVFGIPRARSRDPELAIQAALSVLRQHSGADRLGGTLGRVGISAGQVMVSRSVTVGPPVVLGSVLSRASELLGLARSGEVLVSAEVERGLSACVGRTLVERGGSTAVQRVFHVTDVRQGFMTGTPRPLVGRDLEKRVLTSTLEACRERGRGAIALIRGSAGIGKSRLLLALASEAEGQGFGVHRGWYLDFGVGASRGAAAAVAASLIGVPVGSGVAFRAAAIEEACEDGLVSPSERLFLNELLGVPQTRANRSVLDAMDEAQRVRSRQGVLEKLIRTRSRERPLLLAIDDAHWADCQGLADLAAMIAAVRDCPAMLALTVRPGEEAVEAPWRSGRCGIPRVAAELGPLNAAEALELAHEYGLASPQSARRCAQRSEGNPFFLEQLLRAARDGIEAVPGAIQRVVQARVDRLAADDVTALKAASVLGQRFSLEAVREMVGQPDYGLSELLASELVYSEASQPRFAHALIQQAVYDTLVAQARNRLHRRAAAWFAECDPALRAEHLERAGAPQAARAYLEAAQAEEDEHHHRRALELAERGLDLSVDVATQRALNCFRGEQLRELGDLKGSMAAFETALALSADAAAQSQVLAGLADALRVGGQTAQAMATLDQAEAAARSAGPVAELARIQCLRGSLYFRLGDLERCITAHEEALVSARRCGSQRHEALALGGLGDAHYLGGRIASAHDHFDRCVAISREHGFGRIEVGHLAMCGLAAFYRCQPEAALRDLRDALERTRSVGNPRSEMVARSIESDMRLFRSEWLEMADAATAANQLAGRLGDRSLELANACKLGFAELALGRPLGLERMRTAFETAGRRERIFAGPYMLAMLAWWAPTREVRARTLDEGTALLGRETLSHNPLNFYPLAIEVCLRDGDWERTTRYADALEQFTAAEPIEWSDLFAARGRARVTLGRGLGDGVALDALQARVRTVELNLFADVGDLALPA